MMATPMTKSMIQYALIRAPALKDASPLRGRRLRCSLPALSSNVFLSRCSAMQLLHTKGVPSPSVCKWLCDDTSRKLLSQGPDLPKELQKLMKSARSTRGQPYQTPKTSGACAFVVAAPLSAGCVVGAATKAEAALRSATPPVRARVKVLFKSSSCSSAPGINTLPLHDFNKAIRFRPAAAPASAILEERCVIGPRKVESASWAVTNSCEKVVMVYRRQSSLVLVVIAATAA